MENYFEREDLQMFNNGDLKELGQEAWNKFLAYYGHIMSEGKLTRREKCLIALAVAHAVHCPYCIEAYTEGSMEEGITKEEMMEAVYVASGITGGAILANSIQMKKIAESLEF